MDQWMSPDIILSIVTIILSCVAIGISIYQNYLNKKQALFNRKLKIYLEFQELLDLHSGFLEVKDSEKNEIKTVLSVLAPSIFMDILPQVINEPSNLETRKFFMMRIEKILYDAHEIRLLTNRWNKRNYKIISNYLIYYAHFFDHLYKYYRKNKDNEIYIDLEANETINSLMVNLNSIFEEINENNILEKFEKSIKI